jgi:phosphoglycerate dehydrogenase-like enzyme
VSEHAGLTNETEGSVNRDVLEELPEDSILVNTARGKLINEGDLLDVMAKKEIWVGLDVFAEEPLPNRSPLRRHPRIVITPHSADRVGRMRASVLSALVTANVTSFIEGRSLKFVIGPETYDRMT